YSFTYDTISIFFLGAWTTFDESVDTLSNYTWWTNSNSLGFPIADMSYDATNSTVFSVNWIQSITLDNKEISTENVMNLYPNPASDFLTIETSELAGGMVEIYDFNGKKVLEENLQAGKTIIALRDMTRGAYVAVLKNAKGGLSGFQKFEIVR